MNRTHFWPEFTSGQKYFSRSGLWAPKGPAGSGARSPQIEAQRSGFDLTIYSVAAMTALMVCIRFSASSKTMEAGLSKTSSVTSMAVRPNFSWIC